MTDDVITRESSYDGKFCDIRISVSVSRLRNSAIVLDSEMRLAERDKERSEWSRGR